jgi:glutamate N-acetyltransferase / amino-acid N-acetyltransferase
VMTDQGTYTIAGISKGAGMIAPNMATMLGVVITDAALPLSTLDECLRASADRTYNRIVVDGDMSPNDTVLLLANGASGVTIDNDTDRAQFQAALDAVCEHLAQAIVRDGEGATTFITLNVSGTATDAEARQVANTIATSPLVKTAFYGGDANWGRIIAAAGRSGVSAPLADVALTMAAGGDHVALVAAGLPLDYDDAMANAIAAQSEVVVNLQWGAGPGTATVWTCDLTHDYVSINGHYRT